MSNSFKLNNGILMPAVGFGTFPFKEELLTVIPEAIAEGYKLFDTAWLYQNESFLKDALQIGYKIRREDVFLTSKVNCYQIYAGVLHHKLRKILPPYKSISRAYQESCNRLGVDWLDLYLLHYPYPNFENYWSQMEVLYSQNKVKAIGVSNFGVKDLDRLMKSSSILPAVNQVEMSPYNTNKEVLDYCNSKGIQVEAFSPFGRGLLTSELMKESLLCQIAKEKNKSVGQIILRWLHQCGVIVIPRSSNQQRIRDNIDIFGFDLTESEMMRIDSLNRNLRTVNGIRH